MQIVWLRAFVKLAEQKNFSSAADELFISQSSLSKYIKLLEKYVNIPLFDRTTRKLQLTPAGEQLYRHAVRIVGQFDEMMSEMRQFADHDRQQLRIVQVSAVNIYGYSMLISQFCKDNPDIDFEIRELEMSQAMRALKNGDTDLAAVRTNLVEDRTSYKELRLNTEEMMFLCNRQHRYAQRQEVTLAEILQERLVLQKFAVDELMMLFQRYDALEQALNICTVTTRASVMFDYVQAGLGVSVVSRSLFRRLDPEQKLCLIPIREKPELTLGILIKNGPLSNPCCRLINYINDSKLFAGQYIPVNSLDQLD